MTGIEIAVAVAAVVAAAASTAASISSAQSQAKTARFNAKVAERNAQAARAKAAADAKRKRREGARLIALNRARIGKGGLAAEGSVVDMLADNQAENELDALIIEYGGELEAAGRIEQAALFRAQADNAEGAIPLTATATLAGGLSGAGRSLMTSGGGRPAGAGIPTSTQRNNVGRLSGPV